MKQSKRFVTYSRDDLRRMLGGHGYSTVAADRLVDQLPKSNSGRVAHGDLFAHIDAEAIGRVLAASD